MSSSSTSLRRTALGQAEEEKRAQAEFQRLRTRKREQERLDLLRPHVVTQQELEEQPRPE